MVQSHSKFIGNEVENLLKAHLSENIRQLSVDEMQILMTLLQIHNAENTQENRKKTAEFIHEVTQKAHCVHILRNRMVTLNIIFDDLSIIFIVLITMNNPGRSLIYLYWAALQAKLKNLGKKIDFELFCNEIIGSGLLEKNHMSTFWEAQKYVTMNPAMSLNMIDNIKSFNSLINA